MKTKSYLLLVLILIFGIKTTYAESFIPDQMAVEIIPEDYNQPCEIRDLAIDVLKFTNNTSIKLSSVAPEFNGFKFLALQTSASYKGKIVPSATGEIYLLASGTLAATTLLDWTKTDYQVQYQQSSGSITTLYIYKISVNLGDTINIPVSSNYAGISAVAKSITIKSQITTDNKQTVNNQSDYFFLKNRNLIFSNEIDHSFDICIYNTTGKIVLQKIGLNPNEALSVGSLKKGIYLVNLNMSADNVSKKILIK
ncbi:MAG: T9SS type A sorting domain-containing protein [Paludibacter sp.]|nr:T9SS type A sorting domain-containing protein [Paludibacter sp.]